jgi:hypothetical protein
MGVTAASVFRENTDHRQTMRPKSTRGAVRATYGGLFSSSRTLSGQDSGKALAVSTFENNEYQWRETYFVLFDAARRPTRKALEKALLQAHEYLEIREVSEDEGGLFSSLTVVAPEDFSAMDLCYVEGEEVTEQIPELVRQLKATAEGPQERAKIKRISQANARIDILHFERISGSEFDLSDEGMFDPSGLLVVMEAVVRLTEGVGVDPQSGAFY